MAFIVSNAAGGQPIDRHKFQEVTTLDGRTDSDVHLLLLQVAKQVQPIMRKRCWTVLKLSEFSPSNPRLLGLNIGGGDGQQASEIRIRCRPAGGRRGLFPFHVVLGTMLHELAHIVRGPHDAKFYKCLDELKAECNDLMARGVSGTGQGFDAPSVGRLGSHGFISQHNPKPGKMRDAVLRAAEERAKRQRVMLQGPQRLGGDRVAAQQMTPAQAAARAAERRRQDNVWCPSERLQQGETVQEVEEGDGNGAGGDTGGEAAVPGAGGAGASRRSVRSEPGMAAGPSASAAAGAVTMASSEGVSGGAAVSVALASAAVGEAAGTALAHCSFSRVGTQGQRGPSSSDCGAPVPPGPGASDQQQQQRQRQRRRKQEEQQQGCCKRPNTPCSETIDLTLDSDDDGPPQHAKHQQQPQQPTGAAAPLQELPVGLWAAPNPAATLLAEGGWVCTSCTLVNNPTLLHCDACLSSRPSACPRPTIQ